MRFLGRLRLLLLLILGCPLSTVAQGPGLTSLNPNARAIFQESMAWGDRFWDPQAHLLRSGEAGENRSSQRVNRYTVRASSWYAFGLLARNGKGDNAHATEILEAVLAQQYDAPGKPWDGTFRRSPEEPDPPAQAAMWHDYDPNWREFIGVTFALILEQYPDRISPDLARRMNASIVHAVAGELANHRLEVTYTNPALMFGFLWDFAATRGHRSDWIDPSRKWQTSIYSLYNEYGAFNEFNSPTYCGVDLYALALWRKYGSTSQMQSMGREMEAGLWRNLAAFYNANLKNLSGPFDRSYGMDMQDYVSLVGLALRTVLDSDVAPYPRQDPPVNHDGDLWLAPQMAVLGVRIPSDAMRNFRIFDKPKLVRQQITKERVATAWIGKNAMWGGEATSHTIGPNEHTQFHAATVHWRTPDDGIGWIQLTQAQPLNVVATPNGLEITCTGDIQFLIHAEGATAVNVGKAEWLLPGMRIRLRTDAKGFSLDRRGQDFQVRYSALTSMTLTIR